MWGVFRCGNTCELCVLKCQILKSKSDYYNTLNIFFHYFFFINQNDHILYKFDLYHALYHPKRRTIINAMIHYKLERIIMTLDLGLTVTVSNYKVPYFIYDMIPLNGRSFGSHLFH